MNITLQERLIRAEEQFLLAVISNDEDSLKVFFQEWSQLAHDIEKTKVAGRLDDDTILLLSRVSGAIENMTVCMLESGSILKEAQTCSIIQDIRSGGAPATSHRLPNIPPCHLLFSTLPSSTTPRILGQIKLLDSYAYKWLMQNIHDPYPNPVQTQIFSDVSGTSTAQVEHWFREVRDAIGWSKLSRDFFAGSANATVATARRVYQKHDKNVSFNVVFAFRTVKAFAETLFLEHPSLQGKSVVDTESALAIQAMNQDHHMSPFMDDSLIDPEGVLVPSQVYPPVSPDPFSDLSDSDESEEEEDTTPPPSIAGCKRALADMLTSHDLERPQKRRRCDRSESANWAPSSELECPLHLPSTLGLPYEQCMPYNSATVVSPFSPSHPLPSRSPESRPDLPSSIPQRKANAELNEGMLEGAMSSSHTHVSTHGVRKRRFSESDSLLPCKRQCHSIIPPTGHSTVKPMSASHSCPDLSLPQGRPFEFDEVPQPTLSVLFNPDAPVNFGVFDWNSISDPSATTASSMSQPPIVYVPSSDLKSQLLEPPDFGHDAETRSSLFVDLGSLEDLSSSLQIPASLPDLSTFTASPHSGNPLLPLQDFDWSSITEFLNWFSSGSMQSSSPSASSSTPATPPGNPQESLPLSGSCNPTAPPLSVLDSSVPPSAFLPFGSGAFSEDMDSMWSFIHNDSNLFVRTPS